MITFLYSAIIYLMVVNFTAFACFGLDKAAAKRHERRIPEMNLLMIAFVGGSAGSLIGQKFFRHKTLKQPFKLNLQLIVVFQMACLIALSFPSVREAVYIGLQNM